MGLDETLEDEESQHVSELEPSISEEPLKMEDDRDVEKVFDTFLNTIVPLIKSTIVAESVVLLLVNFPKKQFFIRYKLTEHPEKFSKEDFVDLGSGLPAILLQNKNSLLENSLPEGNVLIPYYEEKKQIARSFIGVPIFYNQKKMGVLCADSSVEGAFSNDDLSIIKKFSKLISIQIISSNKLYEYETENWIAKVLYDFSKGMLKQESTDEFWAFLCNFLKSVFNIDRVVISERISNERAKISVVSQASGSPIVGQEFPMDEGMTGWVFRNNQSLLVDDFSAKENYIPRFFLNEAPSINYLSLLAVPIQWGQKVEAVICLESFNKYQFKDQYKRILETMAFQSAAFVGKSKTLDKLLKRNIIDESTGLGNLKAFESAIEKEISRTSERQSNFSLALMKLKYRSKNGSHDIENKFIKEFVNYSSSLFPKSSSFYRISDETFGAILPEKEIQYGLTTCHEICKRIRSKKIWADGLVDEVSVNCGLVQCPDMGENPKELIEKAFKAVLNSETEGPNTAVSFQSSLK